MVDSGPYPSDGESRAPRKHRSEQHSSRPNTRDGRSDSQDGYTSERNPSRSHHERSQNRPRERDEYHGDRRQNRHREDRSWGHHQERDRYHGDQDRSRDKRYNDGGQSRYEADRSRHRYDERDGYYRESSPGGHEERNNRHKERSRSRLDERDRHQESYVQSVDRHGLSMNKKEPEHYYPAERSFSPPGAELHDLEYYEAEREGGILDCHKCKYLCTGRGILQMLEVILNALVLICIVASHFSLSGFSAGMASGGFGGGYYPFEGQELQEVRQLDQEFTLLRAPLIYGGLTVCLLTGTLTLAILAHGSRHLLGLSQKWLLIEAVFSTVASLGYGAAVGVFLHFALQINSTDVCKKRERLYARNGLTWMNCNLAGTDGGAATFAIILLLLYVASVVLAARAYQEKKALQQ
ncbi:MARVEL domain-containing protein 3 isoform X2 [Ranitomeya variabilis]|uniref:MARVEL domain-containing protein 3 isoform X2 n=1 Tax=Ranitomeya variabilis TaxID=490064 RepID=UPI00405728C8